jgi:hypothetical protein
MSFAQKIALVVRNSPFSVRRKPLSLHHLKFAPKRGQVLMIGREPCQFFPSIKHEGGYIFTPFMLFCPGHLMCREKWDLRPILFDAIDITERSHRQYLPLTV